MYKNHKDLSTGIASLLKVMTMVAVAVFMMSLATTASAQFSVTGQVVAVDTHKMTITVNAYNGPNKARWEYAFGLDRQARVIEGEQERSLGDLRVGDWVTVNYHQESVGLLVAEGIVMTFPPASYTSYERTALMSSLPGKIVAIDKDAGTFTIDPWYYYGPSSSQPAGPRVFAYREGAIVMIGGDRRDFRDLRVGDWVTVLFHQDGKGFVITDEIAVTTPPAYYQQGSFRSVALPGKVVAIDRDARILTIDPSYCYGPNYSGGIGGARIFAFGSDVVVMVGTERRDFRDLRVGDWVMVSFHQESTGRIVADGVAMGAPYAMSCTEKQG